MYCFAYAYVGARALRAPRANRVFATDEKRIRSENTVIDKSKDGLDLFFIQDRRLRVDVLFIHAQSAIRADGTPAAQALAQQFERPRRVRRY
jgi:hypothetical protein